MQKISLPQPSHKPCKATDDFLCRSFLGVSFVTMLIMPPFCINNFVQGRYPLGLASLLLICVCTFNAWSIFYRDRYYPLLTLLGLSPTITFLLVLCLLEQQVIGMPWCYPATVSFFFVLPERKAWAANLLSLSIIIPLVWRVIDPDLAARMTVTLLMMSIFAGIFVRVINEQQNKLKKQAVTDPLTGLFNRVLLPQTLAQTCAQSRRSGIPMTLVTVDIDHFKSVNDTYGHDVGDRVIRDVSGLLLSRLRLTDKAFRLGGEEFLVVLYNITLEKGGNVAEELRDMVALQRLLPDRSLTISIGLATLSDTEDWQAWMKRSDENLYLAKNRGRNQVAA